MSVSEDAIPPDGITRIRGAVMRLLFVIDGLRERARELWAQMAGHEDDEENDEDPVDYYDVRRDERRALTSVLRDLLKEIRHRPPPSFNNGGDDSSVKRWVAGVGAVLAAAFIIAGWTISTQVAGQSVQLDNLIAQMRDVREQQREQNARISRIENERRP